MAAAESVTDPAGRVAHGIGDARRVRVSVVGNGDAGHRMTIVVQHRRGDAREAGRDLSVLDGIATPASLRQESPQCTR